MGNLYALFLPKYELDYDGPEYLKRAIYAVYNHYVHGRPMLAGANIIPSIGSLEEEGEIADGIVAEEKRASIIEALNKAKKEYNGHGNFGGRVRFSTKVRRTNKRNDRIGADHAVVYE